LPLYDGGQSGLKLPSQLTAVFAPPPVNRPDSRSRRAGLPAHGPPQRICSREPRPEGADPKTFQRRIQEPSHRSAATLATGLQTFEALSVMAIT